MRTDPPLVSIITPVYNGAQYLEELIQSVRGQEYPRIEHLIIDDGSTDGGSTLAILKRNPHLRWWSRENRGQYATMNEGLQAAHGDIVCFVSADDLLVPGAVGRAAEFFRRCPECDVAIGRTQFITESGAPYADAPFQSAPVRCYAYLSQISHCSMYSKRDRLLDHDLRFDPGLHFVGDYDWILRIIACLPLGRIDAYLAQVRVHAGQTSKQHRHAMTEEQRRVVAAHHVNPILFAIAKCLVITIHDLKKLWCTWASRGPRAAWHLIASHLGPGPGRER